MWGGKRHRFPSSKKKEVQPITSESHKDEMLSGSYTEEQNRITTGIPQKERDPAPAGNRERDGQPP